MTAEMFNLPGLSTPATGARPAAQPIQTARAASPSRTKDKIKGQGWGGWGCGGTVQGAGLEGRWSRPGSVRPASCRRLRGPVLELWKP